MHPKKKMQPSVNQVELNVMPFIDVFSLLCTFLLFSAVWIAIGILEVQIPFLSNAPDPKKDQKPERELNISVAINQDKLTLESSFSLPPIEKQAVAYTNSADGIIQLHDALVKLKKQSVTTDRIKVFVDDPVLFQNVVSILDAVKFAKPGDQIPLSTDLGSGKVESSDLFPKVIMASIVL